MKNRIRYCKCKCGGIVTSKNPKTQYIHGHNSHDKETQKRRNKNQSKTKLLNRVKRYEKFIAEILKNKHKCYEIGVYKNSANRLTKSLWEFYYNKSFHKNKQACHTCDNIKCSNIFHIFIGTNQDNIDDCVSKDRHARGERNSHSTITDEDAINIYILWQTGKYTVLELEQELKISRWIIYNILNGRGWRHLNLIGD